MAKEMTISRDERAKIAAELAYVSLEADTLDQPEEGEENYIDVRLQVDDDGNWTLHTGDASYDTDHTGYWGASSVTAGMSDEELATLADELAGEAEEHWSQVNT